LTTETEAAKAFAKMVSEDRGITFDEVYRIRVFDPDKQRQTKELQEACESFTSKITELDTVSLILVSFKAQRH
jgi:translation initiation factor 2 alpha subunit (eIF-2alpha)